MVMLDSAHRDAPVVALAVMCKDGVTERWLAQAP